MSKIYLDYNATAPLLPEAKQAMTAALELVGNPSSIHGFGREARKQIEQARRAIADAVRCDPTHLTFTSGATESNNWVLQRAPVTRILVSAIEHPSVYDLCENRIAVTHDGVVDITALEKLLQQSDAPTLVSVMWVNNETGVIQPIDDIAALCRKYRALLHVDAVQALGRIPTDLSKTKIDFLSLSAHKIGGPAGCGALICNPDVKLPPLLRGGGQERRTRAGTENLIGIVGFGAAAQALPRYQNYYDALEKWRNALETKIKNAVPQSIIVGQNAPRIGNTLQFITPGLPAEKQLIALDLAGVAVSSGSACSSGSVKPSHVLLNMGYSEADSGCAIRLSMGPHTIESDLEGFFSAWVAISQRTVSR